ncbi:MAG: flippase-like domain-containing protein [Clostridia bacterium]|nr:flippase-like domain-containing protein [Clostridia bacterium]
MEILKFKQIVELPTRRSSDIKESVLFSKKKLSSFHLYEKLKFKTLHYGKYFEQVVAQPDISQDQLTTNIAQKSNEAVKEQRGKKGKIISTIFMIINICIVVGILLYNFLGTKEPLSFSELLTTKINWLWLFIGVLVFFAIFIADSSAIYMLIFHTTKRSRPFLSYKSHAMCRFYDSVTPLSTGGQPFQVYYLIKRGLPAGTATSVPVAKYLYTQFFNVIFMATIFILQRSYIVKLSPFMQTLCYIGFSITVFLLGAILFLSLSKKVAPACTIGLLKLLNKMHIVKNYKKSFVKVMKSVKEYSLTMRQFVSNGWIALGMMLSRALTFILTYSVPFVVYAVFKPLGADWFSLYVELFTIAMVTDLACCFIPLPGGTGMAEISFAVLFGSFFGDSLSVWALLLWRVFTYYGILLQGLIVMLYDYIIGNRKIKPLLARFKEEDEKKEILARKKQPIKVVDNKEKEKGTKK